MDEIIRFPSPQSPFKFTSSKSNSATSSKAEESVNSIVTDESEATVPFTSMLPPTNIIPPLFIIMSPVIAAFPPASTSNIAPVPDKFRRAD